MLMTMAPTFNKTICTNIIVKYRLNINLYKYIKMTLINMCSKQNISFFVRILLQFSK